jgi:single-stranded-DNA-specific exonuclease
MKEENVPDFVRRFEEVVSATIEDKMLTREIEVDAELNLRDITPSFFRILKQFAPFGPGNMAPIFRTSGVRDNGRGRVVGNNHLKLSLTQEEIHAGMFDGIAFQLGHHHPKVEQQEVFDVVYHVEENSYNGRTSLQLNIKDIKFASGHAVEETADAAGAQG